MRREVRKMGKKQKIYQKVGQIVCEGLGILAINATFLTMLAIYLMKQERSDQMPVWYKKYHDLLQKCKRISRCTTIHSWFEQTDARLRARMQDLEMHKKRTRLSAKRIQFNGFNKIYL